MKEAKVELREMIITRLCNQPPIHKCKNSEHYSHKTVSLICKECLADQILALVEAHYANEKADFGMSVREATLAECEADKQKALKEGIVESDSGNMWCLNKECLEEIEARFQQK
uniref:Uncharacterized protein n=1 Tax=viral metagenome TaxID=1070528 RepID=A0A6H2A2X6_9ZZZZ